MSVNAMTVIQRRHKHHYFLLLQWYRKRRSVDWTFLYPPKTFSNLILADDVLLDVEVDIDLNISFPRFLFLFLLPVLSCRSWFEVLKLNTDDFVVVEVLAEVVLEIDIVGFRGFVVDHFQWFLGYFGE